MGMGMGMGMENPPPPMLSLLTVKEVALQLHVCGMTVRRLVQRGVLPAYRIGRAVRFSPKVIEEFIAKGGHGY